MRKHSTLAILGMIMIISVLIILALNYEVSALNGLKFISDYFEKISDSPYVLFYSFWCSPIVLAVLLLTTNFFINKTSKDGSKRNHAKTVSNFYICLLCALPAILLGVLSIGWHFQILYISAAVIVVGLILLYFSKYFDIKVLPTICTVLLVLGAFVFVGGSIYAFVTDSYDKEPTVVVEIEGDENHEKIQAIMDVADSFILKGDVERALEELRFGIEKFSDAEELTAMYAAIQQSSYTVNPDRNTADQIETESQVIVKNPDGNIQVEEIEQAPEETQQGSELHPDSDDSDEKNEDSESGFFKKLNDSPKVLFYIFWGSIVLTIIMMLIGDNTDSASDVLDALSVISFFVFGIVAIGMLIYLGILSFAWKIPILYISFIVLWLLVLIAIIEVLIDDKTMIDVSDGVVITTGVAIATCLLLFIGGSIYTFVTEGYVKEPLAANRNEGTHTYELHTDAVTWLEAQQLAIDAGGKLVTFESTDEYEYVLELINTEKLNDVYFFIGGRRKEDTQEYFWVDENGDLYGSDLCDNHAVCDDLWFDGEPSYEWNGSQEQYLELHYDASAERWGINDVKSSLSSSFLTGYIIEFPNIDDTATADDSKSSNTEDSPSKSLLEIKTESEHVHVSAGTHTVTTEASCTQAGKVETIESCACGFEISKTIAEIPATGHSYQSSTMLPTCLNDGFITYTCSACKDSYIEQSESLLALGHSFSDGICTRCRIEDPDYIKVYSNKEIITMLNQAKVNSSSLFSFSGSDPISVFAKDRTNCFSFQTAVSYNIWGNQVQNVTFNVEEICKDIPTLYFSVGGADGSDGKMLVEFFVDGTTDSQPTQSFEIEASAYPIQSSINIENSKSLIIQVTNRSSTENKVVFFDFSSSPY